MTTILSLIATLWFLVAGFNGAPKDYARECQPTAIWHYDGTTEQWFAWFPQFEDPNYLAVPEAYGFMIDWMFVEKGYWVACPTK